MTIIEKDNKIKLTMPRITADMKLDPPVKYPLPQNSGFGWNIVGPSGSGKTSLLVSFVKNKDIFKKRFHNVITVIPQSSLNSLKSNPFEELSDGNKFEDLTLENLETIIERVEENRANDELTLLILDDISAELQDANILKKMMRLFLNRRHLYLSIICIAHSLTGKAALPYAIRKNCSHVLCFKPSCSLENLNSEFLHKSSNDFRELCEYVFDKPHNHLFIHCGNNKLFKNFNTLEMR